MVIRLKEAEDPQHLTILPGHGISMKPQNADDPVELMAVPVQGMSYWIRWPPVKPAGPAELAPDAHGMPVVFLHGVGLGMVRSRLCTPLLGAYQHRAYGATEK